MENHKNQKELNKTLNELKEYRRVIDEATIISETDLKGNITYANRKFCEISGYSLKELIGKPHNIVRHRETPSSIFKELWRDIRAGKIWRGVLKNRKKSGDYYIVKATVIPIFNESGDIKKYVSVREDITEIENARLAAKSAEKMKEQFLATMTHEIRTPLNAILGFVDLLKDGIKDLKYKRYIDTIDKSGKTLLSIINDVLDLAKVENGKMEVELISVNPSTLISDVSELFEISAYSKGINLVTHSDIELPHCIDTDPMRVKQILGNLVSNAIKFTDRGKSIYIYSKVNREFIDISIEDEGIGVPESKQREIFNAYEQTDKSIARQYGGTGLGLSISYKLAKLLGGDLTLFSRYGSGSRFTLSIPIQKCKDESKPKALESIKDQDIKVQGDILIVDDNENSRIYMKILLEKLGLSIDIAKDGLEAIEYFQNRSYDLIFMDENMPNLSGIKTVKIIREQEIETTKHTPIIALTATVVDSEDNIFLKSKMDGYLLKPIDKYRLNQILKKFLKDEQVLTLEGISQNIGFSLDDTKNMVKLFKKTTKESLKELKVATKERDYAKIQSTFHKIAGSIGNILGLSEINTLAREAEKFAIKERDINYKIYIKEIKKMLKKLPSIKKDLK